MSITAAKRLLPLLAGAALLGACGGDSDSDVTEPPPPVLACDNFGTVAMMASTQGALASGDCQLTEGQYIDPYTTTVGTQTTASVTTASTAFAPYVYVLDANRLLLAEADPQVGTTTPASLPIILGPGQYILAASSVEPNRTGAYTLSTAATTIPAGCDPIFITRGVSVPQQLSNTDCVVGGRTTDSYIVALHQGWSVTASAAASGGEVRVSLIEPTSGTVVATQTGASPTISHTVTNPRYYLLEVSTAGALPVGYTLSFQ